MGYCLTNLPLVNWQNLNLFNLQISVYDIDHRFSDFVGVSYSFSRLLENIQLVIKQGIPLSLSVLVGKHNIDDLDKYHDTFQELGVREIFYNPYITPQRNGRGRENIIRLSRKEMDEKILPIS